MASITLRSAVGRPLTNSEVDANFSALNLELGQKLVASLNLLDLPNPAQARSNLGLGNVENKSSATIRGELTSGNVTGALGYTPLSTGGGSIAYLGINNASAINLKGAGSGTYNTSWIFSDTTVTSWEAPKTTDAPGGSRVPLVLTWRGGYASEGGLRITGGSSGELGGYTLLHGGNFSSYALPLSGGVVTGFTRFLNPSGIEIGDTNSKFWIGGSGGTNYIESGNAAFNGNATLLFTGFNGTIGSTANFVFSNLQQNGNQVLHAGNSTSYQSKEIRALRYTNNDFNALGTTANGFSAYTNYIPNGGSYNQPTSSGDFRVIQWGDLGEGAQTGAWGGQIVQNFYDDRMWFRRQFGNSWQEWREFIHDGNYVNYARRLSSNGGEFTFIGNASKSDTGHTYIHVKTNLSMYSYKMTMFRIMGYHAYGGYGLGFLGCYTYGEYPTNTMAGAEPYGILVSNLGTVACADGMYYSSDGYVVLRLYWPSYYTGLAIHWVASGGTHGSWSGVDIVAYTSNNSSAKAY